MHESRARSLGKRRYGGVSRSGAGEQSLPCFLFGVIKMAGLGIDNGFPRVISSRAHAAIDYAHAATNFIAGALFWDRNRVAAAAAFALGANVLTNALMTDYELGVFRKWSFRVHGALDYGAAVTSAMLPALLSLEEDSAEARYFYTQGAGETFIAGISDYEDDSGARRDRRPFLRAA